MKYEYKYGYDIEELEVDARRVLKHIGIPQGGPQDKGELWINKLKKRINRERIEEENLLPIMVRVNVMPKDDVIYYEPRDIVSKSVKRNQQIIYWCKYPFTIYFGGTSIITDKPGAHVHQIQAFLKSEKRADNTHVIENAWIYENALAGRYKYFVAVAVPPEAYGGTDWKVIVDDPEDVVRDPDKE